MGGRGDGVERGRGLERGISSMKVCEFECEGWYRGREVRAGNMNM